MSKKNLYVFWQKSKQKPLVFQQKSGLSALYLTLELLHVRWVFVQNFVAKSSEKI